MNNPQFKESKIASLDGTTISYFTIGSGPGLLIIHGTLREAADYEQLAIGLSGNFTVHIIDRRGRGNSGIQGVGYSLKKEAEDVTAIFDHTQSKFLFGHSFGGAVGLELAFNNYPLAKMAIYEPAISIDNSIPIDSLPQIHDALAKGDDTLAFVEIMKIVSDGSVPDDELPEFAQRISKYPVWAQLCALFHTAPAEIVAVHDIDSSYAKYKSILTETLFMYGGNSSAYMTQEVKLLAETLPHTKIINVEGAGHNGPDVDTPEKIAEELKLWFNTVKPQFEY